MLASQGSAVQDPKRNEHKVQLGQCGKLGNPSNPTGHRVSPLTRSTTKPKDPTPKHAPKGQTKQMHRPKSTKKQMEKTKR